MRAAHKINYMSGANIKKAYTRRGKYDCIHMIGLWNPYCYGFLTDYIMWERYQSKARRLVRRLKSTKMP